MTTTLEKDPNPHPHMMRGLSFMLLINEINHWIRVFMVICILTHTYTYVLQNWVWYLFYQESEIIHKFCGMCCFFCNSTNKYYITTNNSAVSACAEVYGDESNTHLNQNHRSYNICIYLEILFCKTCPWCYLSFISEGVYQCNPSFSLNDFCQVQPILMQSPYDYP